MHLLGLAARREVAADGAGAEAEGELLADLAVVVGDDVAGVGVDANQAGDLDVEPGFSRTSRTAASVLVSPTS